MSPRTPRSATRPPTSAGTAPSAATARIRRAAALPMPDGASMSPFAPADPLGTEQDERTARALATALSAARSPEPEPQADPGAWRPGGTGQEGREAGAEASGEAAAAGTPQGPRRTPGTGFAARVTERPFLVAAAVAGAVIAATPFLASHGKDHLRTYEGMGAADPVAKLPGGTPDRHPDASSGQLPIASSEGDGSGPASGLMDPDAGAWHARAAAAADHPAADSPTVPQALAADPAGAADQPASVPAGARTSPSDASPAVASDVSSPVRTTAPQHTAAAKPAPTENATTHTAAAKSTPAKPATAAAPATTATAGRPDGTTQATATTPATARTTATAPKPGSGSTTATARAREAASGTAATAASVAEPATAQARAVASVPAETPLTPLEPTTTDPDAPHDHATGSSPAATTSDATRNDSPAPESKPESKPEPEPKPDSKPESKPDPKWTTEVVNGTHVLRPGQSVASNRTHLTMRSDGNLVITDENGAVRWSSQTPGQGNYAVFQTDGDLVVRTAAQQTRWSAGSGGNDGARLILQNDGNITILATDGRVLWAAGTQH